VSHHRHKISTSPTTFVQIHTLTFEELKGLALTVRPPVVTPIELAAQVDEKAIFKLLLENLEPFAETPPLFNGIWAPHPSAPVDRHVLVQNTDLPPKGKYANKADLVGGLMGFILQLAIKDGTTRAVDMSLQLGADVNAGHGPNDFGPLHVAAWCRQDPACLRLVLKYGQIQTQGTTTMVHPCLLPLEGSTPRLCLRFWRGVRLPI
jgi:ankyrin repeat protein